MAACYDRGRRVGSKARGTRSQFRLNSQSLLPFKCTRPVLTDIMETNQPSQTGHLRGGGLISPIRGGRTVRQYDQEIEELRKENFDLKLRLYLVEQKLDKNFSHDDYPVEVDFECKVETEALQNELSYKNKILQDALDQAESYEADLKESLSKNALFQEQIDSLSKKVSNSIELMKEKEILEEKVKKSSSVIQGLVSKYKQELDLLPKELRPIVISAVQAAREKSKENLVLAVQDFKLCLCEIMSTPFGDVFDSSANNDQIKCIKEELSNKRALCKSLQDKIELTVNESENKIKELKKILLEKEVALENHCVNLDSRSQEPLVNDEILNNVHEELSEKNVVELLKILLMSHQKNKQQESLYLVCRDKSGKVEYINDSSSQSQNDNQNLLFETSKSKNRCEQNVDYILSENKKFFDENENLKEVFVQITEIMKENYFLESEINEKLTIIYTLTEKCSKLEHDMFEVQRELRNSILMEEKDKLSDTLKSNAVTKTDAAVEAADSTFSEHCLAGVGHSSNNTELQDKIHMLLLTVDERDKELLDMQKEITHLQAQLESTLNPLENDSTVVDAGYCNEVSRLHERLACSCNVNNELMKHLQNLAVFMEELLQQQNIDNSSTENISEVSDLITKLSNCLDQSLILSHNLSEQLSICEGSRVFDLEDASLTVNEDPLESQSPCEQQSYQQLNTSHFDNDLQVYNDAKSIGGRSFHMNRSSELYENITRTGKRRRWSYSMQQEPAMDISMFDNDNVIALETGHNDDLVLLLNDKGAPEDAIRNDYHNLEHSAGKMFSISKTAVNAQEIQPRRRCWDDNLGSGNVFNEENSKFSQQVGSMTFFNRKHRNSKLDITWYNPCPSSDSDIWSEPDRDVSMQRIGIDVKTSPCQLKSPSRKTRINRDRQTTDEVSSVKGASSHGYVKTQSCPRRRRSSGSAMKRLFVKKDCKLDKQLSFLMNEFSQFTSLLDNFEEVNKLNSNKTNALDDVFLVLTELKSSIGDTTQELTILKEKLKNGNPVSCQMCVISELKNEIEGTIKKINNADIFEDVIGTAVEHIVQKLFLEVDNLKKLLEESLLDSTAGLSIQNLNGSLTKSPLCADLIKKEKEQILALQNVINELNRQNELLKAEQEELQEDLISEQNALEILNNEKNELRDELLDLKNKIHSEEEKNKTLFIENLELNKRILEGNSDKQNVENLIGKQSSLEILTNKKNELHDELLDLKNKIHSEMEKNKTLLTENFGLNKRLLEADSKINGLNDLILRLELERDTLETENANFKRDESSVNDLCKQLQKDLKQTKAMLAEMSVKCSQYEKVLSGHEVLENDKNIKDLKQDNNKLYSEVKNRCEEELAETSEVKAKMQHCEEHYIEILKLQELLENEGKQKEILEQKKDELLCENKNLILERNDIKQKYDFTEKMMKDFESEKKLKKLEYEEMALKLRNVDQLLLKSKDQSSEIVKFKEMLKTEGTQLEILKQDYDELLNKNKDLITEESVKQEKLDLGLKRITELEMENRVKQQENENMSLNIKNYSNLLQKIGEQNTEIIKLQEKLQSDAKQIHNLKQEYDEIFNKNKDLIFEKNTIQDKLNSTEKTVKELEIKASSLGNMVKQLELNKDKMEFQNSVKGKIEETKIISKISQLNEKRITLSDHLSKPYVGEDLLHYPTGTVSLDSIPTNDTEKFKKVEYKEMNANSEQQLKKIKALQAKSVLSEKRIELLERQKSELREHLLAQVHGKDMVSVTKVAEKSDFQLQLEKKTSFITELKSDLFKTSNLLVDKQTEIDDLKQQISTLKKVKPDIAVKCPITIPLSQKLDTPDKFVVLKKENSELKLKILGTEKQKRLEIENLNSSKLAGPSSVHNLSFDSDLVPESINKNINRLRMCKWDLIRTIFALQKQFYQVKAMRLDHFANFVKHVENLYSLQFSNSLLNSQSQSEPILSSINGAENVIVTKQDVCVKNILLNLELDIECLQNFKIFLNRFVLPIIMKTVNTDEEYCRNGVNEKVDQVSQLESEMKQFKDDKDILYRKSTELKQLVSMPTFQSIENLRRGDGSISTHCKNDLDEMALNLSHKLSYVENMFSSLDLGLETSKRFSQAGMSVHEKYSDSAKRSLLLKLVNETKNLLGDVEKVSQLNSAFKAINRSTQAFEDIPNKPDISDKESVLSDDTLTLSRSQSLSPVSFDDVCLPKVTLMEQSQSMDFTKHNIKTNDKDIHTSREHSHDDKQLSYKRHTAVETVGSSQDSVCHRSHFSSPDLGIESDPNHESSAPEQVEKDFYFMERRLSKSASVNATGKHNFAEKQRLRKPYTYSENAIKTNGDTLHAIGILQEYELLKQEVQESLVGIKSVLSRTGDGLHHIAKYTSPRKSLEYSTFKAIRDTCGNIEVCLTEAQYLINNFHVLPYPTTEDWNMLLQQNQELNQTLLNLKSEMNKQENDFKDAMKKLQHAQLVKENMERKISKKLIKTKKVLRQAKMELLEPNKHKCHEHSSHILNKNTAES